MCAAEEAVAADISAMIRFILEDGGLEVTRDARFMSDLGMASIDMVSLAGRLQAKYGGMVNFAYFADLDSLSDLRVRDLVNYIMSSADATRLASQ